MPFPRSGLRQAATLGSVAVLLLGRALAFSPPDLRSDRLGVPSLLNLAGGEVVERGAAEGLELRFGQHLLQLRHGRREAGLDGLRLFLGWPAQVPPGKDPVATSSVAWTDADRRLLPILTGEVEAGVRKPTRVVLDPGHGGRDSGGIGTESGLVEKTLTLELAKVLAPKLSAIGLEVVLTRDDDTALSLAERPAIAAKHGADLFLSLHFNVAPNQPEVRGIETYQLTHQHAVSTSDAAVDDPGGDPRRVEFFPGNAFDRANSLLAHRIHRRLLAATGLPDRGLKLARFAVLREATCPAVLIEGGYVSNREDSALLADAAWLDRLATAIAEGVADYARDLRVP